MLFGTGGLAAETRAEQVPTVEVLLVNHAAVPQADVADARAHAEEVFGSAGVRLVWTSAPGAMGTRRVVVFLLPFFLAPGDSARGGHHDVLGRATPSVAQALVFADRVAAAVRGRPVRSGVALGQVLAHEIGHLLLPHAAARPRRHHAGTTRLRSATLLAVHARRGRADSCGPDQGGRVEHLQGSVTCAIVMSRVDPC
jgi:hypothetical protein